MSNPSIPIDKERGIDPHLCICIHCGKDNNALTIGVLMKGTDSDGNTHYANKGQTAKHNRDLTKHGLPEIYKWEEVTDSLEKIPMGLCDECEEIQNNITQGLEKGGILFQCEGCTSTGLIDGRSELAKEVREKENIPAPEPIGITFENCTQHPELVNG